MALHRSIGPVQLVVILAGATTPVHAAPSFSVVTTESGVQALRDSKPSDFWLSGLSFVDLDHDGDLDLFLADHHGSGLAALNDGHGHFAAASGSYPTSEIHLCLDVDEDGKVDMDMTYSDGGAKWWLNKTTAGSSTLMFSDVGAVDTRDGNESRSEALVDLNRDGKLDWVRGCQGQNFKVDFGDGKGKFTEDSALIAQPEGNALDAGMIFADLDGDGDEDMIINWGGYSSPNGGDDYGRMRVLLNDGKMNLVEKTTELGLKTDHLAILGAGDVDQDGDVDLIGLDDRKFPEVIYLNDGHASFTELSGAVTGVSGSSEYALWGLATLTDLDNDGIGDILIDGRYFFHVLHGTGGGHFEYQNDAWGKITHLAEGSVDGGYAFGDIDGDGDLDLIGFTSGDPNRQLALYQNDLPSQHWLNLRPVGLPGNKNGVNSKIRIYAAGTDQLLWYEEVLAFSKQAQQNYYAFDALERHYGLGTREKVDVTVTFYPSGTVIRKDGVAADTTITLGEDGTNGIVEPPAMASGSGGMGGSAQGGSGGGSPRSGAGGKAAGGSGSSPRGGAGGSAGGSTRSGSGGSTRADAGGSAEAGSGGSPAAGSNHASQAGSNSSSSSASSPGHPGGCSCRIAAHRTSARAGCTIAMVAALMMLWLRRRSSREARHRPRALGPIQATAHSAERPSGEQLEAADLTPGMPNQAFTAYTQLVRER